MTTSDRHLPLLHARYMPAVCPQYARSMPAVCPQYARSMPEMAHQIGDSTLVALTS
jgi:hypothetical protein